MPVRILRCWYIAIMQCYLSWKEGNACTYFEVLVRNAFVLQHTHNMDIKDITLSKKLSLILRHKAREEKLFIDVEGYIKVSDILQHRFFRGKYNVEDIERVVLINDKKRFSLRSNGGELEICANQGHSISGIEKLDLTPITENQPYDIIHGTYYRSWEKIKTEGLSRMKRNHVHFAKGLPGNESVISGMRSSSQIYIYINLPLALTDGILFYQSANEVILSPGDEKGYPQKTKQNDLVKYFSQFGNVIWAHFGHDFLLLDFTEPAAIDKVMAKNAHFLHGRRLVVRHKEVRNNIIPVNDEDIHARTYQSIISNLQNLDNFDEEFLCMARQLQPNVSESFKKYNQICQDLYNFLYCKFPNIQVHPFGSTLTGLGFNNSDIDVFLSNVKETEEDEVDCLNIIKRLLNKSNRFANCFVIPSAKIPIVKCVHKLTGIRCDINIKNMLGVCNSKLIHYYLSIDMKVKQTMIVLKYWGKCHKITGQNHLLTNYSLGMLFIFFLQQQPYNFPSVLSLQQFEYDYFLNIQDCWNGGFVPNYNFHSDRLTCTPLIEIVKQFFTFYSEFPYHTDIICPYLGKPLPKRFFNVPSELPYYYSRYKEHMALEENGRSPLKVDGCMCIQDPFEHCRNTTSIITASVLDSFILMCKLGKKICSETHVLYRLLTEQPPSIKKSEYKYQNDSLEVIVHQGPNIKYISNEARSADNKSSSDQWFDILVNFLTIALKDFLQLITEDETISPSEKIKKEGDSGVHLSNKIVLLCAGKTNMWNARKATAKQLNLNLNSSVVERETAITKHLQEAYKNFQNTTDILQFRLTIANKNDKALITVEKIAAYKKSFKSFAMFFAANIPLWFELYEKDLNKAATEPKKTMQ